MRRLLLVCVSMLVAFLAMGPGSAVAAEPQAVVCVGADRDGFEPHEINTGSLPEVGLGLSQDACVVLRPERGGQFLTDLSEDLAGAQPPSEPPTPEELQAIADAIANADPTNPLAALFLASTICQNAGISEYCNAILSNALSGPVPTGTATLEPSSRSCFSGSEEGTGQVTSFPGGPVNFEYTTDYASQGNLIGVISGQTDDGSDVTGVYGPGCGAGAKALVLFIN